MRRGGGGRTEQEASSDGERDEAVVLLDVAFEDVGAGAQDALEPRPVQLHTLQRAAGHHCGRAGAVHQQRDLAWRTHTQQHEHGE